MKTKAKKGKVMDPAQMQRQFHASMLAAAGLLADAAKIATPEDFTAATVSCNVLLRIAQAEHLIAEARLMLRAPSPIWRRPLPEPSMN